MADPTFQTHYRDEQITTFEMRYSLLRVGCVQEAAIKGGSAVFQVSGSGSASAVTRGTGGLIPYSRTDNTQNTCTLAEKHAPFERTNFDIFATQGDQRKQMQVEAVGTLNRDIEDVIIAQLDTATNDTGASVEASVDLVQHALTILGNNDVDVEDEENVFGLISPAFKRLIQMTPEYSSKDYVTMQPFMGPPRKMMRWNGVNWITSSRVTGKATATEKCYVWHKRAIGHAANSTEMKVEMDYDKKQDLSWCRATLYHGAKLLQNSGIVQMKHDGSRYAAA